MMKVQRQLLLLRCLSRQANSTESLIEQVNTMMLDAYPKAAKAAFRHDLRALRDTFGCVIEFKAGRGYQLVSVGDLALLNLSDDEIAALRFLDSTFSVTTSIPDHQHVRRLMDRIIDLLPPERRAALNEGEPVLSFSGPTTHYPHDAVVLRTIRRAINLRRELRFRYQPSQRPGEEIHKVAPINIFTRDGHLYLLAYCLEGPPEMVERVGGYVDYRVDFIVRQSATVLPRTLPPSLPKRPVWTLRYELAPAVARNQHVAHWFSNTIIDYRDDGSALVTATIHNLWQARQILLRYVDACRVIEPPELVEMMRSAAHKLVHVYEE